MSQLPYTSHAANREMTKEMRQQHWDKIINSLTTLGTAIGEQIAEESKLDYHQVMRRLSELERDEKIYKTGAKKNTSTGRLANVYAIRTETTVLPESEKHYMDGTTTAADFANMIIAGTKQGKLVQQDLFNKDRV